MKKLLLPAAAIALSACATQTEPKPEMVGMANPASVFCEEQGGTSELRKDKDGNEYAMCHLPNGTVVEEWALFRQHTADK